MTTDQTIDGVPRELLEQLVDPVNYIGRVKARAVLRALLDAPAPIPVPAAWMRFDHDQKAIFTRGKRSNDSEPLYPHPTAYRMPAAQLQGEPVAHTMKSIMYAICSIDGFPMLTSNQCHVLAAKLNAEQPAPVAVLPPEDTRRTNAGEDEAYQNGWNACLDEVKRLNQ